MEKQEMIEQRAKEAQMLQDRINNACLAYLNGCQQRGVSTFMASTGLQYELIQFISAVTLTHCLQFFGDDVSQKIVDEQFDINCKEIKRTIEHIFNQKKGEENGKQ